MPQDESTAGTQDTAPQGPDQGTASDGGGAESGSAVDVDINPFELPEGASLPEIIEAIWRYELFTIDDTGVKVSSIVIALAVLVFGLVLSKLIARRVGGKVLPRMKVEPGPASAIQTIVYYLMLTIVALMALQIAGVPLTAFTIFGGALALGIGFGSQNIMSNFISGLILLLERPVKVNDLVTVQGETGVVLKIGARASHIQSYQGLTYIVPNSIMLENSVTNWSLPDRNMRAMISVGVAYGSDTALVKRVLEQLLDDAERVVSSADNRVLFMGFGDSSLDFEVHFWILPRNALDRRQIESDLRFRIDALFREHDITIPFPQRDVHFYQGEPVRHRAVTGTDAHGLAETAEGTESTD